MEAAERKYNYDSLSTTLDKWLNGKTKKGSTKIENLYKAIEIYESDESTIKKIYELSKILKGSEKILNDYSNILMYQYNEGNPLNGCKSKLLDILSFMESAEKKNLVSTAKDLIEHQDYFENYPYARYFIERYRESDALFTKDFLKEEGLDKSTFDYFKDIALELDEYLAIICREKEMESLRERKFQTRQKLLEMYKGITTGETSIEGLKFDELECFNLLPFKDNDTLAELVNDFEIPKAGPVEVKLKKLVRHVVPDKAETILNYLYEHKIFNPLDSQMSDSDIRKTKYIIGGKELTSEDMENVITYMNKRNTPRYTKAVSLVCRKIANGDIQIDEEKRIRMKRK